MVHHQTANFRNSAAQFFLGSIALALVTLAFFRIHADLASTARCIPNGPVNERLWRNRDICGEPGAAV
jgi:hypothetical protein